MTQKRSTVRRPLPCYAATVATKGFSSGAGVVDGRDSDIGQAQVNGELAAMVVDVVEHRGAQEDDTRYAQDGIAVDQPGPGGHQAWRRPSSSECLLQWPGSGRKRQGVPSGFFGSTGSSNVNLVDIVGCGFRDAALGCSDVHSELAEGAGLWMGTPRELVFGNALETLGAAGFILQLRENSIDDGHASSLPHEVRVVARIELQNHSNQAR